MALTSEKRSQRFRSSRGGAGGGGEEFERSRRRKKSGGGPPQSRTQSVNGRLTNRAKRRGVRQSSGAFGAAGLRDTGGNQDSAADGAESAGGGDGFEHPRSELTPRRHGAKSQRNIPKGLRPSAQRCHDEGAATLGAESQIENQPQRGCVTHSTILVTTRVGILGLHIG